MLPPPTTTAITDAAAGGRGDLLGDVADHVREMPSCSPASERLTARRDDHPPPGRVGPAVPLGGLRRVVIGQGAQARQAL
jgi:hypothetical protein